MRHLRWARSAALFASLALALSACGDDPTGEPKEDATADTSPDTTGDADVTADVPHDDTADVVPDEGGDVPVDEDVTDATDTAEDTADTGDEGPDTDVVETGPFDLTFAGQGYDPHDGQMIHVAVVDVDELVVAYDTVAVADGVFAFTFPDLLEEGAVYRVDYYADVNGDGMCSDPGDHVWSVEIPVVSGDVTLNEVHDTDFDFDACLTFEAIEAPFDLFFLGEGFDPHEGSLIRLAVVDAASGEVVATDESPVGDGEFFFLFFDLLEAGKTYWLDYYADENGDGLCDAGSEHVWREELTAVEGNVDLVIEHDTDFTPDACGSFGEPAPGPFDLTFSGTGFQPHEGQTLFVAVVEDATGDLLDLQTVVVTDGTFSLSWPGALAAGTAYRIDYFADVDGDATCEAPPTDHVWSIAIPAVTADVTIDETHGTNFEPDACATFAAVDLGPFDFTFSATGFNPHEGQMVFVAVVDAETGAFIEGEVVTVVDGTLAIAFPDVLAYGRVHHVDYFADVNASESCDAPPTDHVWRETLDAATGDQALEVGHTVDFTPEACETFAVLEPASLSFSGTGFDPHDGQVIRVVVVDADSGEVVASDSATVTGGAFAFTFADSLDKGATYHVDYYADMDADEACDAPPTDHVWRILVEDVADDVTLVETHDTDFTPGACETLNGFFGPFDVTFSGTGFNPHEGQTIYAALVRSSDNGVVADDLAVVTGGVFAFTFPSAADKGLVYHIDYFADVDGDEVCDAPPEDHVWRESIGFVDESTDLSIEVGHTTAFEAAACGSFLP